MECSLYGVNGTEKIRENEKFSLMDFKNLVKMEKVGFDDVLCSICSN